MITCEKCGADNPATARFCGSCGAGLLHERTTADKKSSTVDDGLSWSSDDTKELLIGFVKVLASAAILGGCFYATIELKFSRIACALCTLTLLGAIWGKKFI